MSAPIPEDLQEWYDASSSSREMELIERIAALEAQLNQLHSEDAIITAFLAVWDSRRLSNGMGNAVICELLVMLKAARAALAATEPK